VKAKNMPLMSPREVLKLKLDSIPFPQLKEFASMSGISKGRKTEIIKEILQKGVDEKIVDRFIKQKYEERIQNRKKLISDDELKKELLKVETFSWGVIQGQLDQKIQTEYVRKIVRYDELLNRVKTGLHDDITNYVVCTWFNHWTTVLIEEHISMHERVIPTIKNIKGIDIFFDGQPFDLKVTYLPRDYDHRKAIEKPLDLAVWRYENQGIQRFGADNRLFVVLLDRDNPERSWELKRNFDLVFQRIDEFFDKESVSEQDEILFSFRKRVYTAITKILIISK
jgi:hypothetical protein